MSVSKVRAWGFAPLVILVPWIFLSSGCSFLPTAARRAGGAAATGALEITEATLRSKWETEWKPALVAEAKRSAGDLSSFVRDMLAAQAKSYAADLEAKVAAGTATKTETLIYQILSALGLLGAGKGVSLWLTAKKALAATIHGVQAHASGLPATVLGMLEGKLKDGVDVNGIGADLADALKSSIKGAATKAGVEPTLYGVVHSLTTPKT